MRLNLPVKISILALLIAGSGVVGLAYLSARQASDLLQGLAMQRLSDDLREQSRRLADDINLLAKDGAFLAESDAVEGIARAMAAGGYDQTRNMTTPLWKQRLDELFRSVLRHRPAYTIIRLIGLPNHGRELVRVDRKGKALISTEEKDLQEKGHRDYFRKTLGLSPGQTYFSRVELNREHKVIELPLQPVLRICVPVFGAGGKVFGILVINTDFNELTHTLRLHPENIYYFLTNRDGDYLQHADPSRRLSLEGDASANLFADFPKVDFYREPRPSANIQGVTRTDIHSINIPGRSLGLVHQLLYYDPWNPKRFFIMGAVASHDVINAQSAEFRWQLVLLTIVIVLLLGVLVLFSTRMLTRPIQILTGIADRIAQGEDEVEVPTFGTDEVGRLATSWRTMLGRLADSRADLRRLADSLEEQVKSRTEELSIRQDAIESSLNGLVIAELDGTISYVNPALARILGYLEREPILGQNLGDLWSDKAGSEAVFDGLSRQSHWSGELETRKRGGGRIVVQIVASIIKVQGKDAGIVASLLDITKRKQAETELRQSEERYTLAVEAGKVGVWDLEMDKGTMYIAPHVKQMLGYEITEIDDCMESWIKHFHPEDVKSVTETLAACWEGRTPHCEVEHRMIHKNGSIRWFLLHATASVDPYGKPLRITGTETDISERIIAEQKSREHHSQLAHARRLSVMGEMAAGLAHELNQPLTAITSYLGGALRQLRPQEHTTEDVIEAIDKAFKQALRAGEIVRWMRSFIKKEEAEKITMDIHDAIDVVIELVRIRDRKNGISIELNLDRSLPRILAGPIQVQQLLLNLIWNAVESIDESLPSERIITICTAMGDGPHILVTVRNTGPLIVPEKLARFFDPFFTTKAEGMGLGLSICQSIVDSHYGQFWAVSDEEHGTSFNFTLPISEEDEHADR
jgi:PAS domain S-box-containing protein